VNHFDYDIAMNGAETAETGVCPDILGIIQSVGLLIGHFGEIFHAAPNIDMACATCSGSTTEMGQRYVVLLCGVQNGDSLRDIEFLFLVCDECNGRHKSILFGEIGWKIF
jgi:hypothetical protein